MLLWSRLFLQLIQVPISTKIEIFIAFTVVKLWLFLTIVSYFNHGKIAGKYKHGGDIFEASGSSSGASYSKCRALAVKALKVDEPACTHMKCTFGGVWNGGGGDGQKNLFVASFFFDRAAEASPLYNFLMIAIYLAFLVTICI
jgi:hypothetical protein